MIGNKKRTTDKKAEEKENVRPKGLASRKTRNAKSVAKIKKNSWVLTSSASESSIGSDAGGKVLRERRNRVNYNDTDNLKKQLRGTTAKRKRPVRAATLQQDSVLNFSDFDDYSLVISDNSVSKKRTRCQNTDFDKIKDTDISHIEIVESPTSDVCYTSLETPQSLRCSQSNNFCSPSLVSSECSTNHKDNFMRTGVNCFHDSKLTPSSAVVELERMSESLSGQQLSGGSSRHYNLRNKVLDTFDQSASLFSTPGNKQEKSVHMLTEMLDNKAVLNLQRLSESLLYNHVSKRKDRNLRSHREQSEESSECTENTSNVESSSRNSEGSNCTLYMLAESHHSESRTSRSSASSDLVENSEEEICRDSSSNSLSISNSAVSSRSSDEEDEDVFGSEEEEDRSCSDEEENQSDDENIDGRTSQTPRKITLRNRSIDRLQDSFSEMLTPTKRKGSIVPLSAQTKVLLLCEQSQPISFQEALPGRMLSLCKKIGEGVYGEVFRSKNDDQSVAIKIIPIEGDFPVNDEPQKMFSEILPEIVIAKELSDLRKSKSENTSNFCEVKSVSLVQGKYPAHLIKQWDLYHKTKQSENDRPDMFPVTQLFVVFEFADCGRDLESYEFDSMEQAKSVLTQVAFSLAVAEHSLQFEHRDLHWGNVLIRPTDREDISFKLMGKWFKIPTLGVEANVIDFTLSRLRKDGVTVYSDLATDDSLFQGEGDLQFDVYRNMKKENKNNWETFNPHSNVLWLHYVANKLVYGKRYPSQSSRQGREVLRLFRQFLSQILDYSSSCEMALIADFLNS